MELMTSEPSIGFHVNPISGRLLATISGRGVV